MKKLKVILSGGGTGGHIFPAVAIANEIKRLVPDSEILFVGALGKMEMEKVPAAGYRIIGIPIAGLQRSFKLSNFKLPFLLIQSLLKTRDIIREFQPDVVVGTGGYASGPLLRTATGKNIPALIQEQNSYAGITNKLLSRKARKICVAYEGMEKFFPKDKIMLTGNPVRQDIASVSEKRPDAFKFFEMDPSRKTLVIVGGSLGAKAVNEAIGAGLQSFADAGIQVLWQTGKVYYPKGREQAKNFAAHNIKAVEFISRMDLAYALADAVISRAGAGAISELCIVKKPSILVPLPTAAEDHQTSNAMSLVKKNAALMVKDVDAGSRLVPEALRLIGDEQLIHILTHNIAPLAKTDAATVIAREVINLAGYTPS